MRKNINKLFYLVLLFPLLFISCVDEESEMEVFQQKEKVIVSEVVIDTPVDDDKSIDLTPGMNKIKMIFKEAKDTSRMFKYYFPKSLDITKPISLMFDFHGSSDVNPVSGITSAHFLNRLANTENIIMVYPLGTIQEGTNTYNWTSDENLAFFDEMIKFFKASKTPVIDQNRIYSCGQSSGAIFSYHLAMNRSEVLAAVVPISGQYMIVDEDFIKPKRTVAIRGINGIEDDIVNYPSAVNNISIWADKVGDYTQQPISKRTIEIEDNFNTVNKKEYVADVICWKGGSNDIEFYGIKGEGHGVDWGVMLPFLWDFMKSHTLQDGSGGYMVLPSSLKMKFGSSKKIDFKVSANTVIKLESYPEEWSIILEDNSITVTAPDENVGEASGDVIFTLTKDGIESKETLVVEGKETDGYKIGDYIVTSDRYKDVVGLVYWVDPDNKYKAKAVSCNYGNGNVYSMFRKGDGQCTWLIEDNGIDIGCNSFTDGQSNTDKINKIYPKLNRFKHAAKHCSQYAGSYKFYLPSIKELSELLDSDLVDKLNTFLDQHTFDHISKVNCYWSSTEVRIPDQDLMILCTSVNNKKYIMTKCDDSQINTRGIVKIGDWD